MTGVAVRGLSGGYAPGRDALSEIGFAAAPGEIVAVLGPNGGGKTTLFRALLGELPHRRGEVTLPGRPAYVPQTDRARLDFPVSAFDVALMGAYARTPFWRRVARADRAAARNALERLGLAAEADTTFGALSGGQRQRVLIARALLQDAPVLLLDEPLSGADGVSAARIEAVLRRATGRGADAARGHARRAPGGRLGPGAVPAPAPGGLRTARDGAHAGHPAGDLRRRADRARGRPHGRRRRPPRTLMLAWLTDPFASPLLQRALAEVLLLSLACGPLGVWVLLYRQAYAAESISHGMLPGLVLAALAGASLVAGAAAGVLVAAAGIALVARDERLGAEIGVAVCVSALLGLGALLALAPESPPRLQELLFGDLLGVTGRDLVVAGVLVGGVALALAGGYRSLALVGFDRAAARALGARPARWEPALLGVLAVTTVAAVQGLGSLLLVALVLAPAAAALVLTRRLAAALALAAGLAALSGLAGLLLSYHLQVAAGASVALCAVAIAVLALLARRDAAPAH